ncbi:ATPase [Streptomyces sp. WMMC500]|uniref:N-acetylglucosamine kinase n=1 Tax=Streptomyces sp. WMMC500 TaxID=3015154 RepID=UPI00248C14CE|nr:BadF/BadG/BcrA/BcrD ATPase family protein [Streptomyces sp. WMMC500]WBB60686.1 ATPase [Streptomyces sp. WMMC500]
MTTDTARWVLGVDSGGSGLRIAAAAVPADGGDPVESDAVETAEPVATGDGGIDADDLLGKVLPAARRLLDAAGAGSFTAVCVGAAGMASLGADLRARLPRGLRDALGVRRLALAADGVTAYAGAVGQHPGAVVAAGTGMIAVGTGLDAAGWRRADGWGHLLGDCGGGAWIGRAGLEAAMRAFDGRRGGSAALLARMEAVFGTGTQMPGLLYPRTDRPAVLASFAPEVARCAPHDPVAAGILTEAGEHIAAAAVAVCPADPGSSVALTGGLFGIGEPLLAPLRAELAVRLPRARVSSATATPLAGALRIAAALAAEELVLPVERGMLDVW